MRTSPLVYLPRPAWFDLAPAVLLCGVVVFTTSWTLAVAPWAPDLQVLLTIAALAFPVGLLLAAGRAVPEFLSHLLALLLGSVWTVAQLAPRMDQRLIGWSDYAADLWLRSMILLRTLTAGGRGEDLVLFVAALCLLIWLVAYASAWELVRNSRSWPTLLFNLPVLLLNYTYVSPKPDTAALIVTVAALLLWVHQFTLQRQRVWQGLRVDYPDFMPYRALWAAVLICAVLIPISAQVPRSETIGRTQLWELLAAPVRAARAAWEDAFSTIIAAPGGGSGSFTARSAELGGARQLGDAAVLSVRTPRYDYLRGVAFDTYQQGNWRNTTGELARAARGVGAAERARTQLEADTELDPRDRLGRRAVQLQITPLRDRNDDLLLVAGQALRFSRATAVEHLVVSGPDGAPIDVVDDTALVVGREPVRADVAYTVTALLSYADVQGLRAAGEDYPAWVRDRYLQLPADFPPAIRAEAARVIAAAGAETPYDRAAAIQEYLRTLRYNESIPNPPSGIDPVEWFLFDLQEGYCDYFASAMVLMLRSSGVPARWVRGYAGGEYDAETGLYLVTERVAHSWPEVYFPGYGWERFEPTAADYTSLPDRPLERTDDGGEDLAQLPPLQNLPDESDQPDLGAFEPLEDGRPVDEREFVAAGQEQQESSWPAALLTGFSVLAAAAALPLAWRAHRLRGVPPAARDLADVTWLAAAAGFGQRPTETPSEYAERLGRAWPEHQPLLRSLAERYAAQRYGNRTTSAVLSSTERRNLLLSLARGIVQRRATE